MENQRTEDDFWLIQYQKLIDHDGVMQKSQASIDPVLGYNFLLNGVIHVVPFLLKIWNKKDFDIQKVADADLLNAGIKNAKDREGVLRSIRDFLSINPTMPSKRIDDDLESKRADDYDEPCCSTKEHVPTAPQESSTKSPTSSASSSSPEQAINSAVECVVCMDAQTRVIFLPCGKSKSPGEFLKIFF